MVGPENSPPTLVASGVDHTLGVLAIYQDGLGLSLVYKSGGQLKGASQISGSWLEEPAPQALDFKQEVSLGLLGGAAWVVATGLDGRRYVLSYAGGYWREVGSATTSAN